MRPLSAVFLTLLLSFEAFAVAPSKLVLTNQKGEQSINIVQGSVLPLSGAGNLVIMHAAGAPTNGSTGANVAGIGSIYINQTTGLSYQQTGIISSPVWVASGNGTFLPTTETVILAGAISTTKMETFLANGAGASYAATLAAPSAQDGQVKILKMTVATNPVTVACTNVSFSGAYTPAGTATLTFSAVGHTAIFIAVGTKWVYLGGSAAAT